MRRSIGMLLLPTLVLLACTDTPPTAGPDGGGALAFQRGRQLLPHLRLRSPEVPAIGQRDPIHATFTPQTGQTKKCTLQVRDDGDQRTSVRVWLNGPTVVQRSALLGPTQVFRVPVTLISGRNTIEVSVQADGRHFVLVRIDCGQGDHRAGPGGALDRKDPAVLRVRSPGPVHLVGQRGRRGQQHLRDD